jgi:hypothetical protein
VVQIEVEAVAVWLANEFGEDGIHVAVSRQPVERSGAW